jgi:PAS domain S-box-containing protein
MPKKSGKINSKKALPQNGNNKRPEESYLALLNILEDIEVEREIINKERDRALAIINNLSDGILVFDKKKNLSLINPQAELFFETKAPDIMGKSASYFTEIPLFESLINLLSQEDKKIFRKELSLKKNLILEATVTPLITEKEEMGTLINLHDITKEKTVERI